MTQDTGLAYMPLADLAEALRARRLSATEVLKATLARIEALDTGSNGLHSFIHVAAEDALLRAAKAADEALADGRAGPLAGVPVAVKDLFWTADMPTTAEMPALKTFVPAEDATLVARLRAAGAIVLGKLAMPEGAATTHHPDFGPAPVNLWGRELWTGISSSGSGVALAGGLVSGTLGSDTGGSIRYPSAMNNVTGLMAGRGRLSQHGIISLAPTLDHMGPMARSARDVALLYNAIAGPDRADPGSWPGKLVPFDLEAPQSAAGLRIGCPPDSAYAAFTDAEVMAAVADAAHTLQHLGATLVPTPVPPEIDEARHHAFLLIGVEAAVAHRARHAEHAASYGEDLGNLIVTSSRIDAVTYEAACVFRRRLAGVLDWLLADIDLLLLPVMPYAAPTLARLGDLARDEDPHTRMMAFTAAFNMADLPTLTLPCHPTAAGHPLGFQLVAARGREDLLLRAGIAFQQDTAWHECRPPLPA